MILTCTQHYRSSVECRSHTQIPSTEYYEYHEYGQRPLEWERSGEHLFTAMAGVFVSIWPSLFVFPSSRCDPFRATRPGFAAIYLGSTQFKTLFWSVTSAICVTIACSQIAAYPLLPIASALPGTHRLTVEAIAPFDSVWNNRLCGFIPTFDRGQSKGNFVFVPFRLVFSGGRLTDANFCLGRYFDNHKAPKGTGICESCWTAW